MVSIAMLSYMIFNYSTLYLIIRIHNIDSSVATVDRYIELIMIVFVL